MGRTFATRKYRELGSSATGCRRYPLTNCIEIESCFWGEFTTKDIQAEAMIAPRILGIATKAWELMGTTDGSTLRALAGYYRKIFHKIGWQYNCQASSTGRCDQTLCVQATAFPDS